VLYLSKVREAGVKSRGARIVWLTRVAPGRNSLPCGRTTLRLGPVCRTDGLPSVLARRYSLAILVGVTPALKAARTALNFPGVNETAVASTDRLFGISSSTGDFMPHCNRSEAMLDNAMLKEVGSKNGDARREARGRRSSADLIRGERTAGVRSARGRERRKGRLIGGNVTHSYSRGNVCRDRA
jgi:hypothetical protein